MNSVMVSLDLSKTNTGVVIWSGGGPALNLSKSFSKVSGYEELLTEFDAWLGGIIAKYKPSVIAYELANPRSLYHAKQYWGMVALLTMACLKHKIQPVSVHYAHAKSVLAGRGNATKEEMMQAAEETWKKLDNHDEADAFAVGLAVVRAK